MDENKFTVRMERGAEDQLLPEDFWDVLVHRYFPVLSLTYMTTVIGIAAKSDEFFYFMFQSKHAYLAAFFVAMWVSVPAVVWVLMRGVSILAHKADRWYKGTAALMTVLVVSSMVLLPEFDVLGLNLRTYFAATIPVFFVMYFFFVKGGLPPKASHPLSVAGFVFFLYGAVVSFLF